jgi:hypothetical protein
MTVEAKCKCQYCDTPIAFPREMAGQTVVCPNCKLETRLFLPGAPSPSKLESKPNIGNTLRRIWGDSFSLRKTARVDKNIVTELRHIGDVFLLGGIFLAIVVWIGMFACFVGIVEYIDLPYTEIFLGTWGGIFLGYVIRTLFYALAQIVKKNK